MISSVLALLAAAGAMQTDTTRTSREAFTNCLRAFVDEGLDNAMALDAFQAEYPRACSAQEAAFRAAVIRREEAMRATRDNAEEVAGLEIEDARTNFGELFLMSVEEHAEAQAQAEAEAQAQAQAQAQAEQAQAAGEQPRPPAEEPEAR